MDKKKRKKRAWIWIIAVVLVIIVIAAMGLRAVAAGSNLVLYANYTVARGDVETTITGSGKLASSDNVDVELPDAITVDSVLVKSGDTVAAGDVLATLDLASLSDRAAALASELSSLDRQIKSRSTTGSIYSPVRGRIKYLPVISGDDVLGAIAQFGALTLISSDEMMQVEIATDTALSLYSTLTVTWTDGSAEGTIAQKTADGYIVTLNDDGTPYQQTAQVYDADTLIGEGMLDIHAPVAVYAAGGTIDDVRFSENDMVYANSKLFTLDNEPLSASYQQSLTDRTEKAALYQSVLSYIADPRLIAPQDGVINEIDISDGTKVATASDESGTITALTLLTGGAVKMDVDVDELDINSVSLGQSVSVTLDAFSSETFDATVTHVSTIGSTSGSITTYPVEITLSYDSRLYEGMSGSAVILADSVEDVLLIPIDAIYEDSTGVYVYVLAEDGVTANRVDITTGLSDGTNAEVTSGLSEGDVLQYADDSLTDALASMSFSDRRAAAMEQNDTYANGGN